MKAIFITPDNLEELKLKYDFEKIIYEADGEQGKYVDHEEDELDDAVGKYLVDGWAAFPRGYGIVSKEVFETEFDCDWSGDSLEDHQWFECTKLSRFEWK